MYIPLYVKSNYSFYESLIKIDELIKYCKKNNKDVVALSDNNMIGAMYFYNEAKKNGLKPLIGLEVSINNVKVLIYAKNYNGYKNLIKIETEKNSLTINYLKEYLNNVIIIIPFSSRELFDNFKNYECYLGYSNKEEESIITSLTSNVIFLNEVLYLNKSDSTNYKYLMMIKNKKTIDDNISFVDNYNYILSDEVSVFSSKRGLDNTYLIANLCNVEIPINKNLIPHYENKYNINSDEYLKNLSIKGLNIRLNYNVSDEYKKRLFYELNIIKDMGFSDYFLIVYDYVKYAKKSNILVGPGRGSAGGSLVAYSLGIIDVDPLEYNLLFERFLNPGRVTMPDIDIDFPDLYREDVIKYVRDKYGNKKVAGIIAIGTYRARSVIEEVSKILNINTRKVELVKNYLDNNSILDEVYKNEEFKSIIDNDEELSLLYKVSRVFENFPRNISSHASGIVMSNNNLDDVVPLIKQDDFYITSYEMDYLENLGLLKMDFLGNRNLSTIMDIIKSIKEDEGVDIDFSTIPLNDSKTLELFYRIDTDGIFHFESDAMKNLLEKLKVKEFNDLVLADSLVRPGPDSKTYLERRNNNIKVSYPNNEIRDVLEETYGVLVYQEQIMRLVSVMAGFDLQKADIIRRAMTKNKLEELKKYKEEFIEGSLKNGYSKKLSTSYYEDILNFAKYGFNKAHAVPYSLIAYKMGYLKANYPRAFYINILSTIIGNDIKLSKVIKDAKKVDINFALPNINKSTDSFSYIDSKVYFPLSNIKFVGNVIAREIIKIRGNGFKDIFDTFTKLIEININKKVIESLIYTSAFSSFGYNKRTLIENMDNLLNYAYIAKGLTSSLIERPEIVYYEEYSSDILMSKEKELLGLYLSYHPVTKYKEEYKVVLLDKINKYIGREIDTVILVEKVKYHEDKNKRKMAFIRGSDEEISLDFILFSKVFETVMDLKRGDVLLIRGKVENKGRIQVVVNMAKILNS